MLMPLLLLAAYAGLAVWAALPPPRLGPWAALGLATVIAVAGLALLEAISRPPFTAPLRPYELAAELTWLVILVGMPFAACTLAVQLTSARGLTSGVQWVLGFVSGVVIAPVALFLAITAASSITGTSL